MTDKEYEKLKNSLLGNTYSGGLDLGTTAREYEPASKKEPGFQTDYPPEKDRPGKKEVPIPGVRTKPPRTPQKAHGKKNGPVIRDQKSHRYLPSVSGIVFCFVTLVAVAILVISGLSIQHAQSDKRAAETAYSNALGEREKLLNTKSHLDDARRDMIDGDAVDKYVEEHNMLQAYGSEKISTGAAEADGAIGGYGAKDYGAALPERSLLAKILGIFGINI